MKAGAGGFTLLEILSVGAIIAILAGISIAGLAKGTENSRAAAVTAAVSQVKAAVRQFADENGGLVPITESPAAAVIPTTGAALGSASATVLSNAVILDTVLLTERAAERAINLPAGPN